MKFLYLGYFIIIILFAGTISSVQHENTHLAIAASNGCQYYEIEYFPDPHFKCLERNASWTKSGANDEYILHSVNEIVGYNVMVIWATMILIGMAIVLAILHKKGE